MQPLDLLSMKSAVTCYDADNLFEQGGELMDIKKIKPGMRVSVPREKLQQDRPWEEAYGTVTGSHNAYGVSVVLDGESASVIRVRPEDLDDE